MPFPENIIGKRHFYFSNYFMTTISHLGPGSYNQHILNFYIHIVGHQFVQPKAIASPTLSGT